MRFLLFYLVLFPYTVQAEEPHLFETHIRPVLVQSCFPCHGKIKQSGSLRVDSIESLLKGGDSGPAIVPRKPQESLLIRAIQRQDDVSAMPPEVKQTLRADQITHFVKWIEQGAVWPANSAKFETESHWAFEPIREVSLPEVHDKSWTKTSIDSFILAKQEQARVEPAKPADKLSLIRRATFDLTGLPPTPEEIETFFKDNSLMAFPALVDRLLESPTYGERWGQHWLDVVRYADTAGETADYPVPEAWRYRNYVIDALNADKPYDQFLREQIAGDVIADVTTPARYAEQVTATGFLAISRRFGFDSENYHHLTIQDTIDTLGQSVLGLSLGCARCHDHKFDPISSRDYYALYGIFESTRYPFPGSEQKQKVRSLAPLVPPNESFSTWRKYTTEVAALSEKLARSNLPVPQVVLRSLHDHDGDFELQAAAAGGSNGVLVSPWNYSGNVGVTQAAQSPFRNRYQAGKVGMSISENSNDYRIEQSFHPRRTEENGNQLYVNLDFRVSSNDPSRAREHSVSLGDRSGKPAVEILISSAAVWLQVNGDRKQIAELTPLEWHNIQLTLDLDRGTVSGTIGKPGAVTKISDTPISSTWTGVVDAIEFHAGTHKQEENLPAIEYDNLSIQDVPHLPVATVSSSIPNGVVDVAALTQELQTLVGGDGDLELQSTETPLISPWNAGPNSVVKVSAEAQSPFRNLFPRGRIGLSMPNRGEYDGFGETLTNVVPNDKGNLFVGFDFRCQSRAAGGDGSWRYYLGHGPGNSAAIELFFNGEHFFRRSGDAKESVCSLLIGEWYQVQLTLDLNARTYRGTLTSAESRHEFSGELATGWDGAIDYLFIDSYGHLPGIRPALDADNFVVRDRPLPAFDAPSAETKSENQTARIGELRTQIAAQNKQSDEARQKLDRMLAEAPFPLAYGMSEGTGRDARIQFRGEPDQPGPVVPRGFLKVLDGEPLAAEVSGSGRKELAEWLTRSDNPLTARVMVNRIWQYHFGRGLVKTPNDFGVRGLPPTHPDLLDHLATEFIRSGWSIKAMHRLMMQSATYQQSSAAESHSAATDLYASFPRRRLSAEEIRDSILSVTGQLDRSPAGAHPFPSPIGWGFTQHGPFRAEYDHDQRSIYLMRPRLKRHSFLALFDGADPNATTAERLTTTVPTQALFFMNSPFLYEKTEKWAEQIVQSSQTESEWTESAWRRAVGRTPTEQERAEASRFLTTYRSELVENKLDRVETRAVAAYLRVLIGSNEFLHVD